MKQCPQCFRRFPPDLFFCPHDGEPLRIPTGRLEAAGATGTLPRIPWETESEHDERAAAALDAVDRAAESTPSETPVFAKSTRPLPPAVHTIFNDGSSGGDGATEPFEPIPETGPIRQKDESQKTDSISPSGETSPPVAPTDPPIPAPAYGGPPRPVVPLLPPPPDLPVSSPALQVPPLLQMPPEIPMMAPAYGGPPGRRFADFGTLQPSFAQRFGLPVGFFLVGTAVGAAVGSGLMAVANAGPRFALIGGTVVGLLLGVACSVIGGLLARRG